MVVMPEDGSSPLDHHIAEVFQGEDDQWYYRIKNRGNHKIVSVGGESYTEERGAHERVDTLFQGIEVKVLKGKKKAHDVSRELGEMPTVNPEDIIPG